MEREKEINFKGAVAAGTVYFICLLGTARSNLWSHITILRDAADINSAVTISVLYSI